MAALAILCLISELRSQTHTISLSHEATRNILSDIPAEINGAEQSGPIRFRLALRNDTDRRGAWRLKTEILWPIAFQIRSDPARELLFSWGTTYLHQPTRASQGPELTSAPIILDPGETLALTAEFEHPPGEKMFPIGAIPSEAHIEEVARERLVHGLYFGAQAIFVLFFLVFARVLSSWAAGSFSLYLIVLAALNAHSHGYTAAFSEMLELPYFPLFRVLQVAAILAYINFALAFLNGQRSYPRFTKVIRFYLVIFAAGLAIEMTFGLPWLSMLAGITFLMAGTGATYIALRDRLDGSWYFTAGFATLLVVGIVNFVASELRDPVTNDLIDGLTLFLQLCDAGIFSAAIVSQTSGLRRARDEAREARLQEYQARVALNERLKESTRETERVRAMAEQHRARLATTSHDLRQPLASLRVSLKKTQEVAPSLAQDLSSGIDFLDTILDETLHDTRPDPEAPSNPAETEPVPVQIVFDNVGRMFGAEAADKGLDLRTVATSAEVEIAAIDLVRIVSNLVANAIKYTDAGRILIGLRRGTTATVEVWDTGPGIPADRLDTILEPYDRAGRAGSGGEGLGLSIARDLAERHGCTIDVRSVPGKGSCFSLRGLRIV